MGKWGFVLPFPNCAQALILWQEGGTEAHVGQVDTNKQKRQKINSKAGPFQNPLLYITDVDRDFGNAADGSIPFRGEGARPPAASVGDVLQGHRASPVAPPSGQSS